MVPQPFRVQNQEEMELFFYSIYGNPFNYLLDEYDNGILLDYGKHLEFLNKPRLKQSHTRLLLLVLSRCRERKVRTMWRELFSQFRRVYSVDVIFVLQNNDKWNDLVTDENAQFRDIIQLDHADNYFNIALSVISSLQYLTRYANQIEYVLKTDSDCFVNVTKIMTYLDFLTPSQPYFIGDCHCKGKYILGRRGCPPMEIVNATKRLPCYSYGGGYMLSANAIPKLMVAFRHLEYIATNEDINMGRAWHLLDLQCHKVDNWLLLLQNITDVSDYYIYHGKGRFDRIYDYYEQSILSLNSSGLL